ncbi:MAG: dihydropteroate synthase [Alphaproteobacteria bacterium]|nr:dihydropteroate synthase [Alphaproteobacteria bacterium]
MSDFPALFSLDGAPQVMGILNVTPDSFSGDGVLGAVDYVAAARIQAAKMIADGAALLDVGGESSRPGAFSVSAEEEIRRTAPVIAALHAVWPDVPISIDTVKPAVAAAALEAGARIINDISGSAQAPAMLDLAAKTGAYLVLMHNRAESGAVTRDARLGGAYEAPMYEDVIDEVRWELDAMVARARKAGVAVERLILDPGLGFGKTVEQNLRLINALENVRVAGLPFLLGPSRKSFIGRTLDLPVDERLEGTAAAVTVCVMRGAAILRVHDVKAMARVVKMAAAIARA